MEKRSKLCTDLLDLIKNQLADDSTEIAKEIYLFSEDGIEFNDCGDVVVVQVDERKGISPEDLMYAGFDAVFDDNDKRYWICFVRDLFEAMVVARLLRIIKKGGISYD